MAETEETKQQDSPEQTRTEKDGKKSLLGRILPIVLIVGVMGICAGAGFGLGRLLAGPADSGLEPNEPGQSRQAPTDQGADDNSEDVWYYDMEPVVANLNEPSVARYVSITLTLQISASLSEKDGRALIDQNNPILTDWLTVYLASLGLEDIRGDKNLKSIQAQILGAFNDQLFPESRPRIKQILFRNFAVQ